MKTFHIHFTDFEDSGEVRRIKNINKDFVNLLDGDIIEIAFVSVPYIFSSKKRKFKLNENIYRKIYLPLFPFSYTNTICSQINVLWSSLMVFFLWIIYSPKYVVTEFSTSWKVLKFLPAHVRCIIDVHGATREEYEYSNPYNRNLKLVRRLDYLERRGMQRVDYIICQSQGMKQYLLKKYSFLEDKNIFIYKCGADNTKFYMDDLERVEYREKLGVRKDELLFIYSGGLHKWQCVEQSINIFLKFALNHKAKMLILTKEEDRARSLVKKIQKKGTHKIIIKSAIHNDVRKYLNASDAAFLIRENVVLNQVASPTKLAEYMFCGLPIIASSVCYFWVDNEEFFFNVDKHKVDDLCTFVENSNRVAISRYANEVLSLNYDRSQMLSLSKKCKI